VRRRSGWQLHALAPGDAETTGLLALLLLTGARAAGRQADDGRLLAFAEQDRSRWDERAIARARDLLAATGSLPPGPYQVQAAIAALHTAAPPGGDPDWARLAALHGVLARIAPSPVAQVNRAVAVGRSAGAAAGLAVLAPVLADPRFGRYAPLHAAHADLLERAGRPRDAARAWRRAARASATPAQRTALAFRARGLSSAALAARRPR